MSRTYDFGEVTLGIRTTSVDFGRTLDHALIRYRTSEEASPSYSIVIGGEPTGNRRNGRGFHILYWGTTALIRTLPLPTLLRGLLAELEAVTFQSRRDSIFVRGALVRADGVSAIVPWWVVPRLGELGRRVEHSGLALSGSTWVAIDADTGRVVPVERRLDIDERPLRRFGSDGQAGGDRLFVDEATPIDVVCTHTESGPLLQPITRGLTLHRLTGSVNNVDELRGSVLEGLGRLVAGARCYGVGFASPRDMLDSLQRALGGRRPLLNGAGARP